MRINFGEVRIGDVARRHIKECLDTNWVSLGPKVRLLEKNWRDLFNYPYARAVSSGTSAGTACCMALYDYGAKEGDNVIVPALSFIASANAIRMAGFKCNFVDVRHDMNIDESLIEAAINENTRAIKVVNLMGKPAKLDKVQEIAKKHNLKVIIDACESYGCKYKGKFALEYGDMETASMFIAHIAVAAEGGMVSCNDEKLDAVIHSIRSHGRDGDNAYFDHLRFGANFKQTDIHASIALESVENFWTTFNKRRENYKFIRKELVGFEDIAWFTEEDEGDINCPHGFSITLKYNRNPEAFQKFLDDSSIQWKRNFGSMADHGAFAFMEQAGKFPVATYIGNHGLHIGLHAYLTDEDLVYLASKLKEFLSSL